MKRIFITNVLILSLLPLLFAQSINSDSNLFRSPIDFPIYLSANFGELRSNHFHSGIDIKTQGKVGKKIYACADGYISRIKISPTGYGRTLYITHPSGYTTVYAHLKEFNVQLEAYTREKQYAKKTFTINIFPDKNEIPIKKGDVIALGGNSGYSFGPHLHFEIRSTSNSKPVNPLLFNFDITDNVPPKIFSLLVYPKFNKGVIKETAKKKRYMVKKSNGTYSLSKNDTIIANGIISFGIEANDYFNGSHNRCGIYISELYIDDSLYFAQKISEFSFSETRYINSYTDYELNLSKKKKIHKSFIEPNNKLSIYTKKTNNGYINFNDNKVHKLNYKVYDVHENYSELEFFINSDTTLKIKEETDYTQWFLYDKMNEFDSLGIHISMPKKSLYDNIPFTFNYTTDTIFYSNIYSLNNLFIPVHKSYSLEIKIDSTKYDSITDKLLIGTFSKKGKVNAVGGKYDNGFVKTSVRSFGSFFIIADTIAPNIKPINFINKGTFKSEKYIKIEITDDLSGIANYDGYIDNNWVLFEYHTKSNTLKYYFDEHISKNGKHELKLEVTDMKGNISELNMIFYTKFP